jgi:prophage regulatory protein
MIAATTPPPETVRRRALQAVADDPLLTRRQVEAEVGMSRSTIYRMMEAGTFPTPMRIAPRCVRWPRSEIERWKADQPRA